MVSALRHYCHHDRSFPLPSRLLSVGRVRIRPLNLMYRPHQTPPTPPTPPPTDREPDPLRRPEHSVRQEPHKARMPLVPPRDLQPLHRPPIVLRTHMSLRTVLMHDIPQPTRHDGARERDTDRPVCVDAAAIVLRGVGEVDETAAPDGPGRGHALARLVRAEGLRENDVDEPAGVEGLERPDHQCFHHVAEGGGL